MIKATIDPTQSRDGKWHILLGLSDANERELRQDRPIVFPISELGIQSDVHVCISYLHPDGHCALPKDGKHLALGLNDRVLEAMKSNVMDVEYEQFVFAVFRGKDEEWMTDAIAQFIGPETKTSSDATPTEKRSQPWSSN